MIASPEDVSGYLAAVRDLLSNRVEALRRWQQARNLLEQNHSKRAFDEAMDGIIARLGIAPFGAGARGVTACTEADLKS